MIQNLVQVSFPTHRVHISRDLDTDQIICFKYDGSACDFNSFTDDQEHLAADWMITPIPTITYRVIVLGDESE
jgi:hypothetical protein